MSSVTIDGKELDVKLLEELNANIQENSKISSRHNDLMLKYTKRLMWLTVLISVVAVLQLIVLFK